MLVPPPLCWSRAGGWSGKEGSSTSSGKALRTSASWGQEEAGREREKSRTHARRSREEKI